MNFTIILFISIFISLTSNCVLCSFYYFWTRVFCLISIFHVLRFANTLFTRNIELVFWNVHFNHLFVTRITRRVLLQFRFLDIQSINILIKFVESFAFKIIFSFLIISFVFFIFNNFIYSLVLFLQNACIYNSFIFVIFQIIIFILLSRFHYSKTFFIIFDHTFTLIESYFWFRQIVSLSNTFLSNQKFDTRFQYIEREWI